MAVNIDLLKQYYFTFDLPVSYELDKKGNYINIYPISLKDSSLFYSSCDILTIPKDEINSVEIIQMSYLEYLTRYEFQQEVQQKKLYFILSLCLKMNDPRLFLDEKKKIYIYDEKSGIKLTSKNFEDIRRIIMYQNIVGYDDEYINPELREAIEETKKLRFLNVEAPDLERKMAIISAHNGMTKKQQMEMSLREHEIVFQEICGEIEYMTARPIAVYAGKASEVNWIYPKKKGKLDDYISSVDDVKSKFGNAMKTN